MFFLRHHCLGCCPNNLGGGGGVLGDNHAGLSASAGATNVQENVANLNLNPATDETIFTTESGIEIKSHNVSATGTATSIQYFTLGSYNGTPVNWLIVGASSVGLHTDSTPAGTAVKADSSKQTLVTGVVTSNLLENQLLCVSQYAFNQATYNPNFVQASTYTTSFTENSNTYRNNALAYASTDAFSDYYASYTAPAHVANSLTLGTTLGINGYYGSGSGKIVTNSTFSSNYVFSLSSSHYTTFVGATNYKIPYLFTATSTVTNIWASDIAISGTVTKKAELYIQYNYEGWSYRQKYTIWDGNTVGSASGVCTAYFNNYISTSGAKATSYQIASFSASCQEASTCYVYGTGNYYMHCFNYTTTYSVTNSSISIGYRPAFVLQI